MSWTSSLFGSADVGNSSVGNSNAMANKTTVGDAMANTDHSRTGNSVGENRTSDGVGNRCGNNVREDGLAIVGDLGDVSIDVVGVIVDMLDPAIRQTDRVVALSGGSAIVRLLSVEAGSGVVVSHGVLVGVGGDLVGVDRNSVGYSVTHHGMADSHSMANANAMADANTMADADAMTNSSKQLGASRGSGEEGGDG